jgi:hypothetical protein
MPRLRRLPGSAVGLPLLVLLACSGGDDITAEPFGLHPYHCDATPTAEHLSRGLYGLMVVDPRGGRRPAHEVALVLSGFDVDGDGHNELYGWNGVAGFYERYPIKVLVEFTLPRRGRYMFHPHQRQMAERGAMGWFAAV